MKCKLKSVMKFYLSYEYLSNKKIGHDILETWVLVVPLKPCSAVRSQKRCVTPWEVLFWTVPWDHMNTKLGIFLFYTMIFKKTPFSGRNFLCFGHRHTAASPLPIFTSDISWPHMSQTGGLARKVLRFLRKVSADSGSAVCSATKFSSIFRPKGCFLR